MGVFDKQVSQKDFEKFKAEIHSSLGLLSKKIEEKVTDSEQEARAAADGAVASHNKVLATESAVETALALLNDIKDSAASELDVIRKQRESSHNSLSSLEASIAGYKVLHSQTVEAKKKIDDAVLTVTQNIEKSKEYISESQKLPESLSETKNILAEAKSTADSLQSLLTHSMKRKADIDDVYKEVFGHDVKNANGEVEHVEGLKEELTASYDEVASQVEALESKLNDVVESVRGSYDKKRKDNEDAFEKIIERAEGRVDAVTEQLSGLLPGAMAAGLSAAYEKKKEEEIATFTKLESSFKNAIWLLVLVSMIPFGVDIYLLGFQGRDLISVIKDTPSLVLSIAPLYFPVLWMAYSSNKSLNLSKRLIEEYTHKAVLGKTFSGLSNQIDSLPHEDAIKEELRTHLLYNVLQVSSENPGKLISNYDKSDHPLMEALEHSAKLGGSMEKLSKLPGFTSIAKKLSSNAERLLREQADKVSRGIAIQESIDDKKDEGVA